ncbi:MAG: hypothetical protein WBF04_25000 [Candidatus Sulfotelmatobacter sp.]
MSYWLLICQRDHEGCGKLSDEGVYSSYTMRFMGQGEPGAYEQPTASKAVRNLSMDVRNVYENEIYLLMPRSTWNAWAVNWMAH